MSHRFQVIIHDLESLGESCHSGSYSAGEWYLLNIYITISTRHQKKQSLLKWIGRKHFNRKSLKCVISFSVKKSIGKITFIRYHPPTSFIFSTIFLIWRVLLHSNNQLYKVMIKLNDFMMEHYTIC